MALSLNFTFGTPCAGSNHVPVTVVLTGAINRSRTIQTDRATLTAAPTPDDVQTAMEVLLRLLITQLANKSNANIKTVVEAKTVDLTVTG